MIKIINNLPFYILILLGLFMLQSCGLHSVYEKKIDFNKNEWYEDSILTFQFEIPDDGKYNLYYIVKNKVNYPFSNLYLKSKLTTSNQIIFDHLQEVTLFDKKTGKPYGKGFGGVMEHKFYALGNESFSKGKYTLDIRHYMRQKNISGVIAFGISVEKAQ